MSDEDKIKFSEAIEWRDVFGWYKAGLGIAMFIGGLWFGWTLMGIAVDWAVYFLGAPS